MLTFSPVWLSPWPFRYSCVVVSGRGGGARQSIEGSIDGSNKEPPLSLRYAMMRTLSSPTLSFSSPPDLASAPQSLPAMVCGWAARYSLVLLACWYMDRGGRKIDRTAVGPGSGSELGLLAYTDVAEGEWGAINRLF